MQINCLLRDLRKVLLIFFIFFVLNYVQMPALSLSIDSKLPECKVITHCVLRELEVTNVQQAFNEAIKLISKTPRTIIIEQDNEYIHAESMTKWMHYIDDLEVKALFKDGILQIRSESRVGIGDNGVNKKRIDKINRNMSFLKK